MNMNMSQLKMDSLYLNAHPIALLPQLIIVVVQGRGGEAAGEQGAGHGRAAVLRGVHGRADQGREALQADGQGWGRIRYQKRK